MKYNLNLKQIIKNISLIFLFILPFFIFYFPVTRMNLTIVDDHEIIKFVDGSLTLNSALKKDVQYFGRFRPFWWVIKSTESNIFKTNIPLLHKVNYFLVFITAILIWKAMSNYGLDPLLSILTTWFAIFNKSSVDSWIYLGRQEPWGVFFLILLLYTTTIKSSFSKLKNFLFLFISILISLTKETFVLFIPFIFLLEVFTQTNLDKKISLKKYVKKEWLFIISLLIVFIFVSQKVFSIALPTGQHGNGGSVIYAFKNNLNLVNNATSFIKKISSNLPIYYGIIGIYIIYIFNKNITTKCLTDKTKLLIPAILLVLSIFPQVSIYSGRSYVADHYPAPSITILVLSSMLILQYLTNYKKTCFSFLSKIFLIFLFFLMVSKNSLPGAYQIVYESNRLNSLIKFLKNDQNSIVIAGNPSIHVELAHALQIYLRHFTPNQNITFYPAWPIYHGLEHFEYAGNDVSNEFKTKTNDLTDFEGNNSTIIVLEPAINPTIKILNNKNKVNVNLINLDSDFSNDPIYNFFKIDNYLYKLDPYFSLASINKK